MQKVKQKLSLKETAAPQMSTLLYVITGCGMGYMSSIEHPKALGDIMESAIGACSQEIACMQNMTCCCSQAARRERLCAAGAVYLDTGMDISATYPVCSSAHEVQSL